MTLTAPFQALCLTCSKLSSAAYESRGDGVFLVRDCENCGVTEARVARDRAFFDEMSTAARGANQSARGLIAELLDGCNIECPTCIASSDPSAGNLRSTALLKNRITRAVTAQQVRAILLSGGEPTIHPDFFDLVTFTSTLDVPARVLITNGLEFAKTPSFAERFVEAGGDQLEVFLQWDSLRPEALRDLRGADYSRERVQALDALASVGVTATLVNVVKRGVTLEHLGEVLEVARAYTNVVGVQFQPIRDAGRVLNFDWDENSCEVTDVFDHLPGKVRLSPCQSSPWSTFLGWMSRGSGEITTGEAHGDFYISPTNATPLDRIRIAVLDYSDRFNWTTERSRLASLNILDDLGRTPSVDDYFLNIA